MHDTAPALAGEPRRLSRSEWLICAIAAIGFAFDIYEILMMPLIGGPALSELLGVPLGSPQIDDWMSYILWSSTVAGGLFGFVGGYLTDRFGRRRVLVWSILLYAFSACAAALSTSAWMLLVLRSTTLIGVCVEFVAAVAWLAELFPNPRQRESVLGYTQAFSSIGGLLVAGASSLSVKIASSLPAIQGGHAEWRYTLISGVIPALPLIFVRPFLPESPVWREKKEKGTLRRPSFAALFQPEYRRTTIVTAIIFACGYGAAFGAIQLTPSLIVPGFPEVAKLRSEADLVRAEIEGLQKQMAALADGAGERKALADRIKGRGAERKRLMDSAKQTPNLIQTYQEVGGLLGRVVLAFLAVRIVSRRRLLRVFQIPGLILIPLVFWFPARNDLELLKWGILAAGFFTVAQFSFWGNYLPRVYPVHLRGTGESFAANVGGRMIGTSAVLLTKYLRDYMPADTNPAKMACAAAVVALFVYAVGSIACFFLPEPKGEELPE